MDVKRQPSKTTRCGRQLAALLLGLAAVLTQTPATGADLAAAHAARDRFTLANWDDGGELSRYVYLHMTEFWPHSMISRAGPVRRLPEQPSPAVARFPVSTAAGAPSLAGHVAGHPAVDGVVVVHRGAIVFEAYPRMEPHDKHLYMSVSKPFASTLVGILAARGQIDVAEPVERYLPELTGSGWQGVSVLDVLDMASGIDCRQSLPGVYDDPALCYYQFEASLGWLPPTAETPADPHPWVARLPARRPAGEAFEYTSVNTFVLRWLVERVAGVPYAELIAREIWQPMGAAADAVIVAPRRGVPVAASGISSTLRDLARFGLLFTPSGRGGAEPVVDDALLAAIQRGGRPALLAAVRSGDEPPADAPLANSYQWDAVMRDGDVYKGGYGGQGLYVSPARDLVIAFFGTNPDAGGSHDLRRIARRLATSELFAPPR